jgi:serine/threonine protein kinase
MSKLEHEEKKLSLEDFQVIKCIGEGAFGEVFMVKYLKDNQTYALKQIDKKYITKNQK